MLKIKNLEFVLFPSYIVDSTFLNEYSEDIKSIIGGYANTFELPQEAPKDIPRLIINNSENNINFSLSFNRIDTLWNAIDNDFPIFANNKYIKDIEALFEITSKYKQIKLDKMGIVFNFLLDENKSEKLWNLLINKDNINEIVKVQEEKSIRIVTELQEQGEIPKTRHFVISQYNINPSKPEEGMAILVQIDNNNIFKSENIDNSEKFQKFLNEVQDDTKNILNLIQNKLKDE